MKRQLARLPVPNAPVDRTLAIWLEDNDTVVIALMGSGLWADPRERISGFPPSYLRDLAAVAMEAADAYELGQ